jgi:hypothetical protein
VATALLWRFRCAESALAGHASAAPIPLVTTPVARIAHAHALLEVPCRTPLFSVTARPVRLRTNGRTVGTEGG